VAGPTLAQFVIGLILVLVLDPVVAWLSARGLNRGLAAVLAILVLGLGAFLFLAVVLRAVLEQAPAFLDAVAGFLASLRDGLAASSLPPAIKDAVADLFGQLEQGTSSIDLRAVTAAMAQGVFALLGPIVSMGLVLPFFMFYVLADLPRITHRAILVVPAQWRADVVQVAGIGARSLTTYIHTEAILMAWLGGLTFLGLVVLGVVVDARIADFAVFLAVVAAVSELVPTFGPYIALIPALVFAATIGPAALVAVLALYMVIMFVEGQVLVPRIQGSQFELHPALVIVLILGALAVIGPLGAVLAIPIAAAARDSFGYVFRRSTGLSPAVAADRSSDELPGPASTGGVA
jgi:predicted PurR-regulated permease PerM